MFLIILKKAFTISSFHSDIDESNYAGKIANHLDLDHHIEPFSFSDVTAIKLIFDIHKKIGYSLF